MMVYNQTTLSVMLPTPSVLQAGSTPHPTPSAVQVGSGAVPMPATESVVIETPEYLGHAARGIFTFIIILGNLCTLVGNGLVLIAFHRDARLRRPAHNAYIFSLAITDLLVAVVSIPAYTTTILLGNWPFGYEFCVIWSSLDVATRLETVFIITLITYDRYRSVTRPLDVMHSSKSRVARHVIITYIIATVLTVPFTAWGHHYIVNHENEVTCSPVAMYDSPYHIGIPIYDTIYTTLSVMWDHFVPLCLIVFWNWRLFREVRRRSNKIGTTEVFVRALASASVGLSPGLASMSSVKRAPAPPSTSKTVCSPSINPDQSGSNHTKPELINANCNRSNYVTNKNINIASSDFAGEKKEDKKLTYSIRDEYGDNKKLDNVPATHVRNDISAINRIPAPHVSNDVSLAERVNLSSKQKTSTIVLPAHNSVSTSVNPLSPADHMVAGTSSLNLLRPKSHKKYKLAMVDEKMDVMREQGERVGTDHAGQEQQCESIGSSARIIEPELKESNSTHSVSSHVNSNHNCDILPMTCHVSLINNVHVSSDTCHVSLVNNIHVSPGTCQVSVLNNDDVSPISCQVSVVKNVHVSPVIIVAHQDPRDNCQDNELSNITCKALEGSSAINQASDVSRVMGKVSEMTHVTNETPEEGSSVDMQARGADKEEKGTSMTISRNTTESALLSKSKIESRPPTTADSCTKRLTTPRPREIQIITPTFRPMIVPQQSTSTEARHGTADSKIGVNHSSRYHKATAILVIVASELVIFRTPYVVIRLLAAAGGRHYVVHEMFQAAFWMGWGISLVHPFLFAFVSVPFRDFCGSLWSSIKQTFLDVLFKVY